VWNVCEHGRLLMLLYVAQAINALAVLYACESSGSMHRGWIHTLNCFVCVSVLYVLLPYTHSYRQCVWYDNLNCEGLFHYFCFVVSCCHPVCFSLTHFFHSFFPLCSLPVCVCLHQPASLLLYCSSPYCSSPWVAHCQRSRL